MIDTSNYASRLIKTEIPERAGRRLQGRTVYGISKKGFSAWTWLPLRRAQDDLFVEDCHG